MSNTPSIHTKLTPTLALTECTAPEHRDFGFWLYDETQGVNLARCAKTEREAFVEALTYYQARLQKEEELCKTLYNKVRDFVSEIYQDRDLLD